MDKKIWEQIISSDGPGKVKINCENGIIYMYEEILTKSSDYFARAFSGGMKESKSKEISLPFSLRAVENMFKFLFNGKAPFLLDDILNGLLLADYICLDYFKDEIITSIIQGKNQDDDLNSLIKILSFINEKNIIVKKISYLINHISYKMKDCSYEYKEKNETRIIKIIKNFSDELKMELIKYLWRGGAPIVPDDDDSDDIGKVPSISKILKGI